MRSNNRQRWNDRTVRRIDTRDRAEQPTIDSEAGSATFLAPSLLDDGYANPGTSQRGSESQAG
jgi:hypothetical protein